MTSTDEPRRMLDELRKLACDINEEEIRSHSVITLNQGQYNRQYRLDVNHDWLNAWHAELERILQAIAATLGATDANPTQAESSGTCRNVAVTDEYSDRPFTCSECGARGPMGNGTYHLASSWAMEDGTLAFADSWPVWKYCPNCGRKVVTNG